MKILFAFCFLALFLLPGCEFWNLSDKDAQGLPDGDKDGVITDGDFVPDGDTQDGDVLDGDLPVDGDEESCVPTSHASSSCDSGDVYWYDSCGSREEKKEECDSCTCSENSCVNDDQYGFVCGSGDVYWQDCHGAIVGMKEECGCNSCAGGECQTSSSFSCSGGVCCDSATGLEWQETPTDGIMVWNTAKTYCQDLILDGSGWRLPNISELRSLIRKCGPIETGGACGVKDVCSPCGDATACLTISCHTDANCNPSSCTDDGGPTGCYSPEELSETCSWLSWSSSPSDDYLGFSAWCVHFYAGYVVAKSVYDRYSVRCVR